MSDEPNHPEKSPRLRDLPRAEGSVPLSDPGIWNRPDRPFIVGLIGWLCAAIGYFSFFLRGAQLPSYFMDMKWLNPAWQPMQLTRWQFMGNVSILIAEMLVALLAIAGGLGALKLKEWARRALIYYAIAAILVGLLKAGYQVATFDAQIDFRISTTTEYVDRNALSNREFFYLITTTLMGMVWRLLVITVMTRPHVRAAFDRASGNRRAAAAIAPLTTPKNGGEDDWRSA